MSLSFDEYKALDATALAALIRRGEIDPHDVLETAARSAQEQGERLGAITSLFAEFGQSQLRDLDANAPFYGVPFLLKDLYCGMRGTLESHCTRLIQTFPSPANTNLTDRFQQAGLITFGRTTSPELGLNVVTEPKSHGPCRNPWNPAYSSGGSSGGAAAAVAAGIVPVAHASDGGGSIRIPASCCGLFGLKPSRGLNPTGPFVGEGWSGLAVSHVLSRSVRDTASLLDTTAGAETGAPYGCPLPSEPFATAPAEPGRILDGSPSCPHRSSISWSRMIASKRWRWPPDCSRHKAIIWRKPHPTSMVPSSPSDFITIVAVNLAEDLNKWAARLGPAYDEERLEHCTRLMAERGRQKSAVEFISALQRMQRVRPTGRRILRAVRPGPEPDHGPPARQDRRGRPG